MEHAPMVGIDVAKATLEVAREGHQATFQVANDDRGQSQLVRLLDRVQPALVVLEASGGYEQALLDRLWCAQVPVVRVNPRQARAFARSTGQLAKTDTIDARLLAEMGRRLSLEAQQPPAHNDVNWRNCRPDGTIWSNSGWRRRTVFNKAIIR